MWLLINPLFSVQPCSLRISDIPQAFYSPTGSSILILSSKSLAAREIMAPNAPMMKLSQGLTRAQKAARNRKLNFNALFPKGYNRYLVNKVSKSHYLNQWLHSQSIEAEWRMYASVNQSSSVPTMAYCLAGAKPWFEPVLEYCWLDPKEQGTNFSEILIEIHKFSFNKMRLKVSFRKWQSFFSGPKCVNCSIDGSPGLDEMIS